MLALRIIVACVSLACLGAHAQLPGDFPPFPRGAARQGFEFRQPESGGLHVARLAGDYPLSTGCQPRAGARVLVSTVRRGQARVEVVNGKCRGQIGWVPNDFLIPAQ